MGENRAGIVGAPVAGQLPGRPLEEFFDPKAHDQFGGAFEVQFEMVHGFFDGLVTKNDVRELDVESPLGDHKGTHGTAFPPSPE